MESVSAHAGDVGGQYTTSTANRGQIRFDRLGLLGGIIDPIEFIVKEPRIDQHGCPFGRGNLHRTLWVYRVKRCPSVVAEKQIRLTPWHDRWNACSFLLGTWPGEYDLSPGPSARTDRGGIHRKFDVVARRDTATLEHCTDNPHTPSPQTRHMRIPHGLPCVKKRWVARWLMSADAPPRRLGAMYLDLFDERVDPASEPRWPGQRNRGDAAGGLGGRNFFHGSQLTASHARWLPDDAGAIRWPRNPLYLLIAHAIDRTNGSINRGGVEAGRRPILDDQYCQAIEQACFPSRPSEITEHAAAAARHPQPMGSGRWDGANHHPLDVAATWWWPRRNHNEPRGSIAAGLSNGGSAHASELRVRPHFGHGDTALLWAEPTTLQPPTHRLGGGVHIFFISLLFFNVHLNDGRLKMLPYFARVPIITKWLVLQMQRNRWRTRVQSGDQRRSRYQPFDQRREGTGKWRWMDEPAGRFPSRQHSPPDERWLAAILREPLPEPNQPCFHDLSRGLKHHNRAAPQHQPLQRGFIDRVGQWKMQRRKAPFHAQNDFEPPHRTIGLTGYDKPNIGTLARAGHRAGAVEFQSSGHTQRAAHLLPSRTTPPRGTRGWLLADAVGMKFEAYRIAEDLSLRNNDTWSLGASAEAKRGFDGVPDMSHAGGFDHREFRRCDPGPDLRASTGILQQHRHSLRFMKCVRGKPLQRLEGRHRGRAGRKRDNPPAVAGLPPCQFQGPTRIVNHTIYQPVSAEQLPDFIATKRRKQPSRGAALGHDEPSHHGIRFEHRLECRFGCGQDPNPLVPLERVLDERWLLAHGRAPPSSSRPSSKSSMSMATPCW